MSLFQVQQCLFDYLRALEDPNQTEKPEIRLDGYDLTEHERAVLAEGDVGTLYLMGAHPVIINGYCRAMGYKRADYRPLLQKAADPSPRRTRWQTS
jgi:hypothetical protein